MSHRSRRLPRRSDRLHTLEHLEPRTLFSAAVAAGVTFDDPSQANLNAFTVDPSGNRYVTGSFDATLTVTSAQGSTSVTTSGAQDGFLAKIAPDGTLLWIKTFGGAGNDAGTALAFDAQHGLLLGGTFQGDVTIDGQGIAGGAGGVFIATLDTNNLFVVHDFADGSQATLAKIVPDGHNGLLLSGTFTGTANLNPAGTTQLTAAAPSAPADGFLEKTDASFHTLWADDLGDVRVFSLNGLAADAAGNAVADGILQGSTDVDPGPAVHTITSSHGSAWLATYTAALGKLSWIKSMGQTTDPYGAAWFTSLSIDANGNYLLGGDFGGTVDIDPGPAVHTITESVSPDGYTGFFLKLDRNANFLFAGALRGDWWSDVTSVLANPDGTFYLSGEVSDYANFNPRGAPSVQTTTTGTNDAFVAKYNPLGGLVWVQLLTGTSVSMAQQLALDNAGNLLTAGFFEGSITLDTLTPSAGLSDGFVASLSQSAAATQITLTGLPASAVTGQSLTFRATVTSDTATPYGSVVFLDGSHILSTVALDLSGVAILKLPGLAAGTHNLSVRFLANDDFAASTSATQPLTIAVNIPPIGNVQGVTAKAIVGWAADLNALSSHVTIMILIDGVVRAVSTASLAAPNPGAAIGPGHGFAIALPHLLPGRHLVMAYAVDPATGQAVAIGGAWVSA